MAALSGKNPKKEGKEEEEEESEREGQEEKREKNYDPSPRNKTARPSSGPSIFFSNDSKSAM